MRQEQISIAGSEVPYSEALPTPSAVEPVPLPAQPQAPAPATSGFHQAKAGSSEQISTGMTIDRFTDWISTPIKLLSERLSAGSSSRGEVPPHIKALLSKLDDRLAEVLGSGAIRLVRIAWLETQPRDYRMQRCQDLEAIERSGVSPSPLLTPQEAVDLLRKGSRSIGTLSYGWLTPGQPDPAGARIEVLRAALVQHPHLEGLFWEYAPRRPHWLTTAHPEMCRKLSSLNRCARSPFRVCA